MRRVLLILCVALLPCLGFGQFSSVTESNFFDNMGPNTHFQWDGPQIISNAESILVGDASGASNITASSGRLLVDTFTWVMAGSVDTDTEVDGFRAAYTSGIIKSITFSLTERGRNGDTIVDINMFTNAITIITNQVNATVGATVYTNQANRPTLIGDTATRTVNAAIRAALPDITNFPMGARFTIDVDEDVTQNDGLSVDLTVIYDEPE